MEGRAILKKEKKKKKKENATSWPGRNPPRISQINRILELSFYHLRFVCPWEFVKAELSPNISVTNYISDVPGQENVTRLNWLTVDSGCVSLG